MRKLKQFFLLACTFISVSLLASCNVNASEPPSTEKQNLVIGLECNYAPFNWTETIANPFTLPIDGKADQFADGYDIQISKEIADYLDMNIVIKKMDWDSLIPSLQTDEIDAVIAGMTATDERKKSIDFTDEYYRSELVLIVQKSNYTDKVLNSTDFRAYIEGKSIESQVSTVTDSLIDIFAEEYGAIHNKPVDSFPSAANDVNRGIVFAMTAELPVAQSIVSSNPTLAIVHIDQSILGEDASDLGVSIGIKKGNSELQANINRALAQINSEDRTQMMIDSIQRSETDTTYSSIEKIFYLLSNYYQTFLNGLLSTLILAIVGTIVGLIIGIFIALGKGIKFGIDDNSVIKSMKGLCKGLCTIYSVVLRGTPMMVQALIFKFSCSAIGLNWNSILPGVPVFDGWLICGLIVITLNTGAYIGEDIRAGLNGLDAGQKEAAESLGMNKYKAFTLVVLPQALRNCLPTLANEFIINIKDSSVLNVISVTELFLSVSLATSKNYFMVEGYIIIAAIYLTLTLISTGVFKLISNKIDGKKLKINLFRRPKGVLTNEK